MEPINMIDRRKFNSNLLIVCILIIIFMMQLYNQKLLIHNADRILDLQQVMNSYLEPPLPDWQK